MEERAVEFDGIIGNHLSKKSELFLNCYLITELKNL